MVAAAIIGAAAVGGVAAIAGGSMAAKATQDSSNSALTAQKNALDQQANLSAPYRNLGQSAIPQLQSLLGIGSIGGIGGKGGIHGKGSTGASGASGELAALQATPGYQFTQQQGNQATAAKAASMGLALSGNTLQALDQYNTGLASQTYQNAVNNAFNVTGLGQAAAAGQAANVGNAANNQANLLTNQGANRANIDINTLAGLSKTVGNAANQYIGNQTLQNLNSITPYDYSSFSAPGLTNEASNALNPIVPLAPTGL